MSKIYGYSTIGETFTPTQLTGLDIAKRDLKSHFSIRKGEKWTNPNFGSILPYLLMQPLDMITVDAVKTDVMDVVSYDPRFTVDSSTIAVDFDEQKIEVNCTLTYVPTATKTTLELKFDREFEDQ